MAAARRTFLASLALVACLAVRARAGMPATLPTHIETYLRLNQSTTERLQALSFFAVAFLGAAALVWALWNYLATGTPALPRLTFGRALAGVTLWGLAFVVVLTMISGARELMTPGAWVKQGFTYKLRQDADAAQHSEEAARRERLAAIRTELWKYAATHDGAFPSADEFAALGPALTQLPGPPDLDYLYEPDLSAKGDVKNLVVEPELKSGERLVLRTSGEIVLEPLPPYAPPATEGAKP